MVIAKRGAAQITGFAARVGVLLQKMGVGFWPSLGIKMLTLEGSSMGLVW